MNIPYVFKKCSNCGNIKLATEKYFYKSKTGKWGLMKTCKECKNKKSKEESRKRYNNEEYRKEKLRKRREKYANDEKWREEQLRKQRECHKEKYDNNEEWRKEKLRKRREKYANDEEYREKQLRKQKEKYDNNEEWREKQLRKSRKSQKEKYDNNEEYREEKLRKNREWAKNNPEKLFNRANKRRSRLEKQGRGVTNEQYIECNNWFDWKCAYSGESFKQENSTYGRTLDHIVAIENGGLNEPWNVIPMRKGYNCSKQNRNDSLTWYKEQGYFDEERLNKIVEWQIYAYEKWGGEEFGELILITDLI